MSDITRFGISLDSDLLAEFDQLCARKNYPSRSEAIRDLIRSSLLENACQDPGKTVMGILSLIYNHHHGGQFMQSLVEIQHDHHALVLSSLHIHLDSHLCLEALVLKGPGGQIRQLADRLSAVKGVLHGALTITSQG